MPRTGIHVEQIENGYWLWRAVYKTGEIFQVGVAADEVDARRKARAFLEFARDHYGSG